ncbi:MAG: outer membrane beta-barrel protein [Acidobacteriales bacterium]|nr:outer membrane beta-barrel protein [Candidatus Koribacter versatilis]MBI3646276.1 outer membrane beta-barrel protein [Terriglobales bacterium]
MRKLCTLVLLLTALAGVASAQIPTKGNMFFGYSYNRSEIVSNDATNLNGWNASLEGKLLPWVGIVADISGHYGNRNFFVPVGDNPNADLSEYNFLFGPRVSVKVSRFRPFAELLVGAGHISRSKGISDSDTSFANAVGGGLDYHVFGPVAVRGQLDWIHTRFFGNGQNDVRFSTGVVVHF